MKLPDLLPSRTIRAINIILIACFLVLTIGPVYWVASSSFKNTQEVISPIPTAFPLNLTLSNYNRLLQQSNYVRQLRNSILVAAGTTLFTLLITIMAAFGAYRGNVRWLRKLKFVAIIAFVFPTALLVVPIYGILAQIGLVDTIWSGILVNCILTVPFSFWLVEGFFDAVPRELEEAALVDGANRLQTAWKILLPLITPGLATIAIFAFVASWTEYTFSSVLLIQAEIRTIPLGLADILAQYNIDWGLLTTNTTLAMIPGLVFFALAGRYFISGLVAGALKA